MARGKRVEAGQSLPATVPDKTAISLRNNLFPGQDVTLDGNRSLAEGAIALHRDAWTKSQLVMANNSAIVSDANAKAAVAKAESEMAKARKANAEASQAEAEREAKIRAAEAEADARIRVADAEARVAEAEATTKIRVQAAAALKADIKILKLRKEKDVLTGESEVKEFCVFCLSARLSVCLSLPVFLTRALWGLRILCSPPFSFCFSRQACSRTAEMRSSVAGPCS